MNKYELTEKINSLQYSLSWGIPRINKETVLDLIEQLEEPEKPVVPQFVADWIEKCKAFEHFVVSLSFALQPIVWEENNLSDKCIDWLMDANNQELFARAWLDGYTVEKEKIYTVKVKAILGQYLGRYYLNNEELTPQFIRTQLTGKEKLPTFTRKELEEAGFGWVFNCEGVEVEEVEE